MLLFVHDHKFRRVDGNIYTTGGLSNETLQRYTRLDNDVLIYARIIDEKNKADQWSLIKENVRVEGDLSLSGSGLEQAVKEASGVIIRLPSFLGNKACKLVKKHKKPYMIEMVGCAWDSLYNHGTKGRIIAPYSFLLTRKYVKRAPYVLYVTEMFLQGRYPTNGKSISCSDVVIDDVSQDNLIRRLDKIEKRKGKKIIGTTAAVDVKYKGQEYVIKALGILKQKGNIEFEYQLAGNGDNSYLKRVAIEAGVEDQVILLGGVPHEKIFSWLDSIDVYIQPSFQEGLPRALIEAQSRALPCFGSSTGGIPELLHNDCVFSTKENMASAIATKLETLTKTKESEYAKFDFDKAKCYDRKQLDKKRTDFYDEFIRSVVMEKRK